MQIAILANRLNSYQKPMAQAMARMLNKAGVSSEVFYDGLSTLPREREGGFGRLVSGTVGGNIRKLGSSLMELRRYQRFVRRLRAFNCVILVDHLPSAYYQQFFDDEKFRNDLGNIPIVLYDLIYLCADRYWIRGLHMVDGKVGVPEGNHFGLDRYDFHLCISDAMIRPGELGCDAVLRAGIDLTDESLAVRPRAHFSALIDFERPDKMRERAIQVMACEEAKVDYRVLHGSYSLDEIRRAYADSSVYFLAHYESFGLPILENQVCGNYVFTPDALWCRAHWLSESGDDTSRLSSNFVVYENDPKKLVDELRRIKACYSPVEVRGTLSREQPWFVHGDSLGLRRFLDMLSNGAITGSSHRGRPTLNDLAASLTDKE